MHGAKQVSENHKNALLDLTDVKVQQKIIVNHDGMHWTNGSSIFRNWNLKKEIGRPKDKSTLRCISTTAKWATENKFNQLHDTTAELNKRRATSIGISRFWIVLEKKVPRIEWTVYKTVM